MKLYFLVRKCRIDVQYLTKDYIKTINCIYYIKPSIYDNTLYMLDYRRKHEELV